MIWFWKSYIFYFNERQYFSELRAMWTVSVNCCKLWYLKTRPSFSARTKRTARIWLWCWVESFQSWIFSADFLFYLVFQIIYPASSSREAENHRQHSRGGQWECKYFLLIFSMKWAISDRQHIGDLHKEWNRLPSLGTDSRREETDRDWIYSERIQLIE